MQRTGTFLNRRVLRALPAILVLFGISAANAQDPFRMYKDYDRYRYLPRMPHGSENPKPLPEVQKEVKGDPKILLEHLKGLVFLDNPGKVEAGKLDATGVNLNIDDESSIMNSYAFRSVVEKYIDGPISILRMNELARDVVLFYRENDLPVVDVSVPEQDITDGVVQILVTESVVGNVRIEGARYFNPCVLLDQVCISPGQRIHESVLMEDQRWLYRNPFRTVDMELTPGEERGTTDIVFKVNDKLPWRVYAGYEDTGTKLTGLERTFYGINWYDAFHKDDSMGYQYTASSDFERLSAHSAFYSHAFQNRDVFTVFGSYANFNALIPNFGASEGKSWQILTRITRELMPICSYEHTATLGFDFKQTDSTLLFNNLAVFGSTVDIGQFLLAYQGQQEDCYGMWSIGLDSYYSPGGIGSNNTASAFASQRASADTSYYYLRSFFERRLDLPACMEFVGRFTGQLAEGNLIATEQLGFGGYNSMRGYDQYSVIGDSGYFANFEVWTPPVSPGISCGDELKAAVFYDVGNAYNHTLLPGEASTIDLQSAGLSLRYDCKPGLQLRVDYGWQISNISAPFTTDSSRVHIGVVASH